MSTDPVLGNVTLFAGNYAPAGWMFCQGQLLSISENTALFTLLDTYYGGDGQSTFALPDFRGRVAIHVGQGQGLQKYALGETGGEENITLTLNNLPAHSHPVTNISVPSPPASNLPGTTDDPTGNVPAVVNGAPAAYSTANTTTNLGNSTINTLSTFTGGTGNGGINPVNIVSPYLALNYIIAVEGIYPPHD